MQYVHTQANKLNKLQTFFWPIYRHELKKIVPMFAIFFLISFVYHVLRCLKIAIVVKAPGSGAEIIPFLKVWLVLPSACIFSLIYAKLATKYSRSKVFTIYLSIFIAFFAIFTFLLFPYRTNLELNFFDNLLPQGLHGLSLIFKYWPLALFYVFAEMWSIMVLTVLFWGFTNEITHVDEAKRFYAFIALGANCAAIFSGKTVQCLSLKQPCAWIPYGSTALDHTIFLFMLLATVFSLLIIYLFRWLSKQPFILAEKSNPPKNHQKLPEKQPNKKLSWLEKISFLTKNPELGYLTLIVLAYNIVANLTDIIWNYQLDLRFADSAQLVERLGKLDMLIGLATVILALFGFSNVIRKFGWKIASLTTPVIWLITTTLAFLGLVIETAYLNNLNDLVFAFFQIPVHELIINLFMLQMCLGKATKYTFFDQSKEIAFIPLDPAQQRYGKAIVDGITSRFGKSGSSICFQILLLVFSGEIAKTIPYASAIIFIMFIIWLYATNKLGDLIDKVAINHTSTATLAEDLITENNQPQTT